jgi:hypothetical protein
MLKKNKSFENYQIKKDLPYKNQFHNSTALLAKSTAEWNHACINTKAAEITINNNKINLLRSEAGKIQDIEKITALALIKQKLEYQKTFKQALAHDCFYDIISSNEEKETVTVAFLPISTSDAEVSCGVQQFEKIHLNHNIKGFKNIYITRILFHITMAKSDFIKWSSEYRYQNINVKKAIFDKVQKDLENNHYSLLKDSDLLDSNVTFFSKELPLVKFKFTDLEL